MIPRICEWNTGLFYATSFWVNLICIIKQSNTPLSPNTLHFKMAILSRANLAPKCQAPCDYTSHMGHSSPSCGDQARGAERESKSVHSNTSSTAAPKGIQTREEILQQPTPTHPSAQLPVHDLPLPLSCCFSKLLALPPLPSTPTFPGL